MLSKLQKTNSIIFACIASLFVTFLLIFTHSLNAQAPKGKISVQVKGFENSKGKARLLLFSTAEKEAYPSDPDKAYARFVVPIKNNKVSFLFEDIPYGDYAVSVHHDEDGNDKVNTNFIGIPNEGLGSSNDAKGNFGPPSFDQAKFTLKKEKMSITINMVN